MSDAELQPLFNEAIDLAADLLRRATLADAEITRLNALVERQRTEAIEECAKVCDKHAEWAEDKIEENPTSVKSQLFAGVSNTANDCAEMIRDLLKKKPFTSDDSHD